MLGIRPSGLIDSVVVHPLALVESTKIGARTRVWGFSHVMEGSSIGADCNICEHVFIESGVIVGNGVTIKNGISLWNKVVIEDNVFLGPNAVFTNDLKPRAFIKIANDQLIGTKVCKGATIGAGAIIVCGITIGRFAFVAAGAVVTKNVPDFGVVRGNPACLTHTVSEDGQKFDPI